MTEHPDVILYLLFESIRGDWSYGIPERGEAIKSILPYTNFARKDDMEGHINMMIYWWFEDGKWFDGRTWARDGMFCYYTLFKHYKKIDVLTSSSLLKMGKSDDGSDRMESDYHFFGRCHDDVMKLYEEWERGRLETT
jgi:hypothetical protein